MTTAYTSLLGLALPVTGELSGTWGDTVNNSITSLLDSAISGTTTISTDADITLTTTTGAANQARQAVILWTAGGTVTRNITAPAQSKTYVVINKSSSTQSIVLRGVGPTTGVTIVQGESAVCAWNGTDFIKASSISGAGTFTDLTVTGVASFADGTAALPSITNTGDTNTGIFFPAADTIAFAEGGAEAMRIDSSGNVGIGTTSPSYKLDVRSSIAVLDGSSNIGFWANGTTYTQVWQTLQSVNDFVIQTAASKYISFGTNSTERIRIDTSGNLLSANGVIQFTSAQYRSNVASSQLQFINNSAGVSLAVNGTSWGSLSDERDKEIIEPIADAVSKVASLRSVIGRYKVDDADKRRAFLIAQDVKAVLPEAVTELEDEQKTLILQYTEVIPLLVAAIKELKAEFDAYKATHP